MKVTEIQQDYIDFMNAMYLIRKGTIVIVLSALFIFCFIMRFVYKTWNPMEFRRFLHEKWELEEVSDLDFKKTNAIIDNILLAEFIDVL